MRFPSFSLRPAAPRASHRHSIEQVGADDPIFSEQVKALRAKVEYRIDTLEARTLAVTSAVSGEGKTTLTAKLAVNLAAAGRKKVLLVDADMRKADLARLLELPSAPGLSDLVTRDASPREAVLETRFPGLWFIGAGTRVSEPAELLSGNRFRALLDELQGRFDAILIDTPPVLPVADTLSLRDQVDGFIFVYRAAFTPHRLFAQAVEEVGEKGMFGVVINGVEPERQRYYERYYGSYYTKPGVPAIEEPAPEQSG